MARRGREAAIGAAALLACALFLWADRAAMPITLWDESRNVVNALELRARGWSVVTTYDWAPDLWNTKPPLLIWAMAASADVFGPSVWALRLPSVLATCALLLTVVGFVRRATGSLATALLAMALMALSPALFGEHGARTADYDALLTAFTTGYCGLAFRALGRGRPATAALLGAGALVAGAVLTKSVAGLLPGVGVAGWALASGRWRRVVRDPRYLAALAVAAVPVAAFAWARAAAGPGWLAAAWHNDLGGRFGQAVIGVERPWSFYLSALAAGWFAAPLLLLAVPLAWRRLTARERVLAGQAAAAAVTGLAIASAAQSKLYHYILPTLPFLAMLAAVAARGLWRAWRRGPRPVGVAAAAVLAVTLVGAVGGAAMRRYVVPAVGEGARSGGYGALFAALPPGAAVAVVDGGFVNDGQAGYAPVLRGYRLLAAERGVQVRRASAAPARGIVASCDPGVVRTLAGRAVARAPGCVAVAR